MKKDDNQSGNSKCDIYQSIHNHVGRWGNFILQQTVDDGVIAFTVAVELSYLTEDEQYELHAVMDWSMSNRTLIRI